MRHWSGSRSDARSLYGISAGPWGLVWREVVYDHVQSLLGRVALADAPSGDCFEPRSERMSGWNCFWTSVLAWVLSMGALGGANPSPQTALVLGVIGIVVGLFAQMMLYQEQVDSGSPSFVAPIAALLITLAHYFPVNWALKAMHAGITVVP